MSIVAQTSPAWRVASPAPDVAKPTHFTAPRLLATGLVPLGVLLCDYLFWEENLGFNALAYVLFVVGVQVARLPRHAAAWRSGYFRLALAGSLLSAGLVAWYGSGAAALACLASGLMLLGYGQQPGLRLVAYAVLTALGSAVRAVPAVLRAWRLPAATGGRGRLRRVRFYGRLLVLPLGVLGLFHYLFAVANPRYDALSRRALAAVGEWLAQLLPSVSVGHLLFFAGCFAATAGALVAVPVYFFADQETRLGEFVRRQRDRVASLGVRRPDFRPQTFRTLDLRKEYLAALAVFGLVNALLLVVNLIDVRWIWMGFRPAPGFDLTQFVHEGTYVLIFSILLAMGIVLYFFRRNLNFHAPGRVALRWGATVWVLQNAVLAVSVGLRNYYYIFYTGLAYKRIGVCFFLLLTLFGLGTVLLKIWQRRSAYALVRLNALAAYAVLLTLAAGNWEVWIARYNLQARFPRLDVGFLLDMPPRVLPVLAERRAVIAAAPKLVAEGEYGGYVELSRADALRRLDYLTRQFRQQQPRRHWQSQTVAEWQAAKALRNGKLQPAEAAVLVSRSPAAETNAARFQPK